MGPSAPREALWPHAVEDVLAGHLGPEAVRRLAVEPFDHGLTGLLDECLPGDPQPRLDLLRTKYKPGRKLTAYYRLPAGHGRHATRHLAVSWSAEPRTADPAAAAASAAGSMTEEVRGPFTRLAAGSPDGRTLLLVSPADPAMPQLGRLNDLRHLGALAAEPADRRAWTPERVTLRTVRYRPGQRHVLHASVDGGAHGVFVKTDRDDSGARAVAVAGDLREPLARRCPGAAPVQPLGYSPADSAALWRQVSGQPLSRLVPASTSRATRLVRLVGRAVRALHDHPSALARQPAGRAGVHTHSSDAEITATLRAGEHIAALLPTVGRSYGALVAEVGHRLDRIGGEGSVLIHGDLKCDNLIVDGDRLTILDLDRVCWADPALDLGKFLADLRWWCGGTQQHAAALSAAFRSGYGACDPARWARAGALAALFELKFAARRCALHRADWAPAVQAQVAAAATTLDRRRDP